MKASNVLQLRLFCSLSLKFQLVRFDLWNDVRNGLLTATLFKKLVSLLFNSVVSPNAT